MFPTLTLKESVPTNHSLGVYIRFHSLDRLKLHPFSEPFESNDISPSQSSALVKVFETFFAVMSDLASVSNTSISCVYLVHASHVHISYEIFSIPTNSFAGANDISLVFSLYESTPHAFVVVVTKRTDCHSVNERVDFATMFFLTESLSNTIGHASSLTIVLVIVFDLS